MCTVADQEHRKREPSVRLCMGVVKMVRGAAYFPSSVFRPWAISQRLDTQELGGEVNTADNKLADD